MKKIVGIAFLSFSLFCSGRLEAKEATDFSCKGRETSGLARLFQNARVSAKLRFFYMIRTFDETAPDTKALAGGGIVKYESGTLHGFKAAAAYYGSHRIGGFFSREEGAGTSLLQQNGEDIRLLGEAYLEYADAGTRVKVGRQRLDTPLMGDLFLRILPASYEAAVVKNRDFPETSVEFGYVKSFSGFGSKFGGFFDNDAEWGKRGLAYLYVQNRSFSSLYLRAQYIKALSKRDAHGARIEIEDYRYAEAKYYLSRPREIYFKMQYGGNAYDAGPQSKLIGLKIGAGETGSAGVGLFYDKISDNRFEVIMASPMYSEWQQGYGLYEPSGAMGMDVFARPVKDLYVHLVYVDTRSHTKQLVDDFTEFNFDVKYRIDDRSKVRISYSFKNQSDASEKLFFQGKGGREDRYDVRLIYFLNF